MIILGIKHWGIYFLVTLFAISFLIFFHELGHFLAARLLGVSVTTFSVGFGEKIVSKKFGGTDYCLSAIPLGGYVSLKGQDDLNPNAISHDKDSYNNLTPLGRIFILLAGPLFNILLAFFLYIALGYVGVEKLAPVVGKVFENTPAYNSNLREGDEILSIDGKKVMQWSDIKGFVTQQSLKVAIKRNEGIINLNIQPEIQTRKNIWGEEQESYIIGISPSNKTIILHHKGVSSIKFALNETVESSKLIFKGLQKLVQGFVPLKEVGGIVAIADITSKAAEISLSILIIIVALISVNLGILNLLPIPVLDGGHILFNLYEFIFRRPVPEKIFTGLSYAGFCLLFMLMTFMIVNDILRLSGAYG